MFGYLCTRNHNICGILDYSSIKTRLLLESRFIYNNFCWRSR